MDKSSRLLSLDVFRGADIVLMILVNMTWDRDAIPWQFFHVGWNEGAQGVTITDLVFPWFLFIVGVALPFSMHYGRGAQLSAPRKLLSAFRRGLIIYTLGLILDAASAGSFVFLKWNILQIIGAAYFLGVCLWLCPKWIRAAFVLVVLIGKWFVLSVMPHPDHGRSVWYFQAADGSISLTRYGDGVTQVSGEQLIKSWMVGLEGTMPFTNSINWSPFLNWATNIFNLLPATAVVVMGGWIGLYLLRDTTRRPRTAFALMGAGAAIWFASWLFNLHHPWSKDFFTASYALLTVGTGSLALGACYWLIDARHDWADRRRVATGMAGTGGLFTLVGLIVGGNFLANPTPSFWNLLGAAGVILLITGTLSLAVAFRDRAREDNEPLLALEHLTNGLVMLFRVPGVNAIALYFGNEFVFKAIVTKWPVRVFDPDRPVINAWYGWIRDATNPALGGWLFAFSWLAIWWLVCFQLYRKKIFIKV